MILSFAGHSLDRDRAELRGPGGVVALEPKAFVVLALLAENHDRVVDKDEMIEVVWGGRFMSDAAVTTVVKQVRRAIGDDGAAQEIIRTVRGRGYRLVAPVTLTVAAGVAAPVEATTEVAGPPTIAVLPFARAGVDAALDVLGDAIPAEIISALSRLRWVRVIARESAFRFRGATVDFGALRGGLGAGYALSGAVEAVGGRIAVDVDLVDTRGGVVIWSERFGGTLDDVAEIRARIVGAVVAALDLQSPMAEEEQARLKPDSWKGYTIGDNTNKHLSKWPFRLDDEKVMYPFYEKLVKWSRDNPTVVNVCIHKGLFPPEIEQKFPHLLEYSDVRDVGKAAKDWPQLNFIIYHSGWRWTGPNAPKSAWDHFEKTGRIEWVTDLAEIPEKFGVKNVYGDLGQLFAWTTTANPRLGAAVMGTLIKGLGASNVVWGTDAVWTGAPQWQIEALRRLEIPEEMQKKYGFSPLGAADGPVKNAIFGGNNARLYRVSPKQQAEIIVDRVAQIKETYEQEGPGRTNLAYGYVAKKT